MVEVRVPLRTTPPRVRGVTATIKIRRYGQYVAHTYSSMLVHCVFSTKERRNIIRDPQHLWRYLAGIARGKAVPLVVAGGTSNHVHLLLDLPTTMPIAQALQHLKGSSAHWLNSHETPFAWQQGYGAFAIGQSQRETVLAYIANQEDHHKKYSFEQEFVALLKKYGIQYDDRFVFG